MKRILALFAAASLCGCSAGLVRSDSVWAAQRIPLGIFEDEGEEEGGGAAGRFIVRLAMTIYPGTKDNLETEEINEKLDPRLDMGFGYTMTLPNGADLEVGLDLVPDMADWFSNIYYDLRADYFYWLGESGLALSGGLGLMLEHNAIFEEEAETGAELLQKGIFRIGLGVLYLIPNSDFDLRIGYQIPLGKDLNVKGIILLAANYAM